MDSTGPGVDTSQSVKLLRERDRGGLVFLFFFFFSFFLCIFLAERQLDEAKQKSEGVLTLWLKY